METNKRYDLDVGYGALGITIFLLMCCVNTYGESISHKQHFDIKELNFTSITAPDGHDSYIRLDWKGLDKTNDVSGSPELPVKYIHILVPAEACNFSVKLSNLNLSNAISLTEKIYPIQTPVTINDYNPDGFTYPNNSIYNGWESNVNAKIITESWIEGCHHVVTIGLFPIAYSSASNKMYYCSEMTIELQYEKNPNHFKTGISVSNQQTSIVNISDIVINPDMDINEVVKTGMAVSQSCEKQIYYYIITDRNLLPAIKDLYTLKSQKGYKVITKAIEDIYADDRYIIGSSEEIIDEAASLKCYLRDEFEKNGSFFCLLVGDHMTKMPIRKVYHRYSDDLIADNFNGPNYIPTDFYFSDLSKGNWLVQEDNFGNFSVNISSVVFNPCIYVGRLLCHTEEQIKNYISKLICYELRPGKGESNYLDTSSIVVQYGLEYGHKNIIEDMHSIFNSTDEIFDAQINNSDIIYPTGKDVIEVIQKSGYCSLVGHGEPTTIACYGKNKEWDKWEFIAALEGYNKNDGQTNIPHSSTNNGLNLMNNFNSPGVLYSLACDPASFDVLTCYYITFDAPHTVASSYTVGGNYGGVAFLGNTRSGFLGSSSGLEKNFLKSLKDNPTIGVSETLSKILYSSTGNYANHVKCTHNLIGDPEFEIWKSNPSKIDMRYIYTNDGVSVKVPEGDEWSAVLYDGMGNCTKVTSSGANSDATGMEISIPYIGNHDRMQAIGVYKSSYLPNITLECTSQKLMGINKSFVVTDATIGKDYDGVDFVNIGKQAEVHIQATNDVICKSNLIIEEEGNLELSADEKVTMEGVAVSKGGNISIQSKEVKLNAGFSVKGGGTLTVNNKNKIL